jgi:hypothetical protein
MEQKATIKTILKNRLTAPEYALLEAYMNQEINEFNTAASERNTLLAEVQRLKNQETEIAQLTKANTNLKAWLKELYKVAEVKREEIVALTATNQRLNTLLDNLKLVHERATPRPYRSMFIARKEQVIQTMMTAHRAARKVWKDRTEQDQKAISILHEDLRKWQLRNGGLKSDLDTFKKRYAETECMLRAKTVRHETQEKEIKSLTDELTAQAHVIAELKRQNQNPNVGMINEANHAATELAKRNTILVKRNGALAEENDMLRKSEAHDTKLVGQLYEEIAALYKRLGAARK